MRISDWSSDVCSSDLIAGNQIDFEIDRLPWPQATQRGLGQRVGNDVNAKPVGLDVIDRQADAVDADRAFARDVARQCPRALEAHARGARILMAVEQRADAVDMADDHVTHEKSAEQHFELQSQIHNTYAVI